MVTAPASPIEIVRAAMPENVVACQGFISVQTRCHYSGGS